VTHLRSNSRGAHIVTLNVMTPESLSKEQIELLEQFRNTKAKKGFFK
jgi:DnaJ-class molecular chaperone